MPSHDVSFSDVNIQTRLGNVAAQLVHDGVHAQINAYIVPHAGAGLFVCFQADEVEACKAAMAALVERGPLQPDQNLTDSVPGALAAGSMPRPTFMLAGKRHVEWGKPTIKLAEAA